jgi:REP element-mobilizing transposase RayT
MLVYRRRLPHWFPDDAMVFVTWRLAGSIPRVGQTIAVCGLPTPAVPVSFLQHDDHLDRSDFGPVWLQDTRVASMLAAALQYGETCRQLYHLHAWVIMPNHVHVVLAPRAAVPSIMRWLKGRTGRMANRILGRTGMPFWQEESFDHWLRSAEELREAIDYVEGNPVKAGLVETKEQWAWSNARRS